MGNPAEETYCYPNNIKLCPLRQTCQLRILQNFPVPAPRNRWFLQECETREGAGNLTRQQPGWQSAGSGAAQANLLRVVMFPGAAA